MSVCSFADADWATDKEDRRSVTGWVAKLNGDLISWAAKKQRTVALSTCEAELYAEAAAIQEVLWLRGMLKELGLKVEAPSTVHGDNQSTIAVSQNGIKGERTKHIDVKYRFVTEVIDRGDVRLQWVSTTEQQADLFTKALAQPVHEKFRDALMSRPTSTAVPPATRLVGIETNPGPPEKQASGQHAEAPAPMSWSCYLSAMTNRQLATLDDSIDELIALERWLEDRQYITRVYAVQRERIIQRSNHLRDYLLQQPIEE